LPHKPRCARTSRRLPCAGSATDASRGPDCGAGGQRAQVLTRCSVGC
jgi:hypothetical protein